MQKEQPYSEMLESEEKIEGMHIEVRDHFEKNNDEQCGYCGQMFGPDEVVIEREIMGRKWRFCSEECYRDFTDAANFKDEDLDSKDVVEEEPEEEEEF